MRPWDWDSRECGPDADASTLEDLAVNMVAGHDDDGGDGCGCAHNSGPLMYDLVLGEQYLTLNARYRRGWERCFGKK